MITGKGIVVCGLWTLVLLAGCAGGEYSDPGNLEGRMDQVCDCFIEKKTETEKKECFDLQNKYFELTKDDEKWKFIERMEGCMSVPKE